MRFKKKERLLGLFSFVFFPLFVSLEFKLRIYFRGHDSCQETNKRKFALSNICTHTHTHNPLEEI